MTKRMSKRMQQRGVSAIYIEIATAMAEKRKADEPVEWEAQCGSCKHPVTAEELATMGFEPKQKLPCQGCGTALNDITEVRFIGP